MGGGGWAAWRAVSCGWTALERAGEALPIRASLLEEFHGSSLRPSWRSVVFGQPGSSSFPSKDPSF